MRLDESGQPCPGTLGEYRDFCTAFGGEECDAVRLLDARIADEGRDMRVFTSDSYMRMLLMPLILLRRGVLMSDKEWAESIQKRKSQA